MVRRPPSEEEIKAENTMRDRSRAVTRRWIQTGLLALAIIFVSLCASGSGQGKAGAFAPSPMAEVVEIPQQDVPIYSE
jgi:hypothetical protein